MTDLISLRHHLHAHPDLSGNEENTARIIREYLDKRNPDRIVTGIGGHGLAAVYDAPAPGPRVMIRCELDALPISEGLDIPHASEKIGVSHKCGHDGHMTIVAGIADRIREQRPRKGTVILLFQPAEETGAGAARVIEDAAFAELAPDYVFALHNLPGFERGCIVSRDGVFASASSGIRIHLRGETSHAAEPEAGNSPALVIARLIEGLSSLPQFKTSLHDAAKVTVIHARLGEIAFGTSPGEGSVMATLRAHSQKIIDLLASEATSLANGLAAAADLHAAIDITETFPATVNDAGAVSIIAEAAGTLGLNVMRPERPFAWSEDFGHFTLACKGALFGVGAGRHHRPLHHPEYDFPDALIVPGLDMFHEIIKQILD